MQGIDPTPFTAWGVLGLLGFSFILTLAVMARLVLRQSVSLDTNAKQFVDALEKQRSDNTSTLREVASTFSDSHSKMEAAFLRQARALDKVLLVFDLRLKKNDITSKEIEDAVRSVMKEINGRVGDSGGGEK